MRINGVEINVDIPEITNCFSGPLILTGCAQNVWEDLTKAQKLAWDADIMCVNLSIIGLHWKYHLGQTKIKHWATMHPEMFSVVEWFRPGIITHSNAQAPNVDVFWHLNQDGTSGLFAVKVALLLGYTKIIICGMPLDKSIRFFDCPGVEPAHPYDDRAILGGWREFFMDATARERVRSLSGASKQILGEPSDEWLAAK